MSDLFPLLFLAAALCADILAACFSCGADRVRIPPGSALILAGLPALFLNASCLLGDRLLALMEESTLPRPLSGRMASLLSGMLLLVLGLRGFRTEPAGKTAQKVNVRDPGVLSPSEAFFLGAALSLDGAAAGIGAGIDGAAGIGGVASGISGTAAGLALITVLSFGFGLFAIGLGTFLGRRASDRCPAGFSRLGSVLLILLALFKFA